MCKGHPRVKLNMSTVSETPRALCEYEQKQLWAKSDMTQCVCDDDTDTAIQGRKINLLYCQLKQQTCM